MAFRTQKISQMTPKGANLEATDLIEVSTIESGSYVTRSITGQEIIDAAVGNVDWGDIGGTLSNQTDLQNALDAKQDDITLTTTGNSGASTLVGSTLNVPNYTLSGLGGVPTSRTLTINGVTQDLSANRTFTISTGITIGSTAIASGVVGRVLFEGAGNVVQESSSLFWDNTGGNLSLGTSIPSSYANLTTLTINGTNGSVIDFKSGNTLYGEIYCLVNEIRFDAIGTNGILKFLTNSVEKMRVAPTTGNVLINTTTDAGFRLDVNGTARVSGNSVIKGSDDSNQLFALEITNLSGTTRFQVGNGSQHVRFNQWQPIGGGSSVAWTVGGGISLGVGINTSNQTYTGITYGGGQSGTSISGSYTSLNLTPTINQTGPSGATTRGIYINPTLTSAYDFRAIETTAGRVIFGGLPTSPAGLPTGAIYNNLGVLMIV